MIIKVDSREVDLIQSCKFVLEVSPVYKDIQLVVETLPIGDILICDVETKKEVIVIERKTLRDLAASIRDGRYEEQSYRLNGLDVHNHNIVYLIEGDLNKFNVFKDRIEKLSLYSAMVSLNFYKGFSVLRSLNLEESALFICNMAYKIHKSNADGKTPFYEQKPVSEDKDKDKDIPDNYCNVVKKVKKDNVTIKNIGEIMLCQIPLVSSTIAVTVMQKFENLPNLITAIAESKTCLNDLTTTNAKGQTRKISKAAIGNILSFLSKPISS
jgi:ERCC4-type nuclease